MAVRAAHSDLTQPTARSQSRTARTAQARARRNLIAHVVLVLFVIGALFPFYWMVLTSIKPNDELVSVAAKAASSTGAYRLRSTGRRGTVAGLEVR